MGRFDPTDVSNEASAYGWWEHDYQYSQGHLVILRKHDHNGDTMQLNVWCTTGTVGSYLKHQTRAAKSTLRRSRRARAGRHTAGCVFGVQDW